MYENCHHAYVEVGQECLFLVFDLAVDNSLCIFCDPNLPMTDTGGSEWHHIFVALLILRNPIGSWFSYGTWWRCQSVWGNSHCYVALYKIWFAWLTIGVN